MLLPTLRTLFNRDLERLIKEMEGYHDERNLWVTDKNIANAGGNLCLHLIGNLNTYFGAVLARTGYIRNRELEFSKKDVPAATLISQVREAAVLVDTTLAGMSEEDLDKEYPLLVFENKMSTGYFLVHLATHLAYHLGQVNYHRRLLDINH